MKHLDRCKFLLLVVVLVNPILAQESVLRSGPMVGYGEQTEVMLWAQTTRPADVQLRTAAIMKFLRPSRRNSRI